MVGNSGETGRSGDADLFTVLVLFCKFVIWSTLNYLKPYPSIKSAI